MSRRTCTGATAVGSLWLEDGGEWGRRTERLLAAYVATVLGPHDANVADVAIELAGALCQQLSHGSPCWSELEVSVWHEVFADLTDDPLTEAEGLLILRGFYTFLVAHHHLDARDAQPILTALAALSDDLGVL